MISRKIASISAVLLMGCFCTNQIRAQTDSRPRVGLALQGGGAKGFAHIGFLQWLEEHRIPVDAIAGTSMGGLIGGFYASGFSIGELRELATSQDWEKLIGGQQPFRSLDFRRKEDARDFPNRIEIGLKNGFRLPSGLNSGHSIGLLLDRLTLPYYDLESFDDLPIPFRCVAVDMISGQETVFSEGSLRDALRATMSLPAIFSPVHINNSSFIDGGILDNLPVNAARSMHADYVIAVHLDTGAYELEKPESMLEVAGRSIDIMMEAEVLRSLDAADLPVRVDVQGISTLDFDKGESIISRGYDAAESMRTELLALALDEDEWGRHLAARRDRRKTSIPVPGFVTVKTEKDMYAADIQRELRDFQGRPLDVKRMESKMDSIRGSGRYSAVGYRLVKRGDRPGLLIHPEEKAYGPPVLHLKPNIDGSDPGNVRFGINGRLTMLDLGGYRSEWRTDFAFGSLNYAATEYYRPLGRNSHWFVAPGGFTSSSTFDIYDEGDRISEYWLLRSGFGADIGYQFNQRTEIRVGQKIAWYDSDLRIGYELIQDYSYRTGLSGLRFQYLGQDDAVVPRSGVQVKASANWYSASPYRESGFPAAEAEVALYQPVSRDASIFVSGAGGSAFGHKDLGFLSFSLGGILRMGSYGKNELLGNQYYLFTAGYLHEVASLPPIIGNQVYVAGWLQAGKMYGSYLPTENPVDGSAMLIVKSMLGPLFFGGSWGNRGHRKLYFGLGKLF